MDNKDLYTLEIIRALRTESRTGVFRTDRSVIWPCAK